MHHHLTRTVREGGGFSFTTSSHGRDDESFQLLDEMGPVDYVREPAKPSHLTVDLRR